MKKDSKSLWATTRREFREAAEDYFRAINSRYNSEQYKLDRAETLARHALRLHLLVQGRGTKR